MRTKNIFSSGLIWLWVSVLVLALDRFTKIWVDQALVPYQPVPILPIFNLTLAYNKGAAFSFLSSASGWQLFFLSGIAIIVSIIVLVWLARLPARERWLSISLCLILAGAIGNVWDRASYGYVIDFLNFHLGEWHFAIFNLADTAVTIGSFMMLWQWIGSPKK